MASAHLCSQSKPCRFHEKTASVGGGRDQYSLANMMVNTRCVTAGLAGFGE